MTNDAEPYQAPLRVDTAMFLLVDPCQLTQPGSELAALVEQGKAALVTVQMDGTYSVVVDDEAVGLVVDVDPNTAYVVRPHEARELLSVINDR